MNRFISHPLLAFTMLASIAGFAQTALSAEGKSAVSASIESDTVDIEHVMMLITKLLSRMMGRG